MMRLETERLILRGWEERDVKPFVAMNADPRVMAFFPSTLTAQNSRKSYERLKSRAEANGFHFQPIEHKQSGSFVGFAGLARVAIKVDFVPAIEIGWRLPFARWGNGYAPEAATAWLDYGFGSLDLDEVVSFAVHSNTRSRNVMSRIGMTREPHGDFSHPDLAPDHELARHVFYRIRRDGFLARKTEQHARPNSPADPEG